MRKKFTLGVYGSVVLWLCLAIICMQVPPKYFWPAAFISLSLPGALILNILFLAVWAYKLSVKAILPLLILIFTWNYHTRGIALNLNQEPEIDTNNDQTFLKVLSYNVRIFNVYDHLQDKNQTSSKEMIQWVATNPADVFCLQEFYNEKKSRVFNSISKIGKNHHKHTFLSTTLVNRIGAEFGLAIFSRYPIIHKGTIQFGKLTQNHAMFADLKIRKDTVRVYNFHFQSMSIAEKEIVDSYSSQDNMKKQGRNVLRRFKNGFVKRSDQVKLLTDHMNKSPYPIILCGDINDLPYSYTYQTLAEQYTNAFSEAGWGVGATYNGPLPFIRIDNQFCSKDFDVLNFTLHDSVSYSDHFPLSATYLLKKNND